MADPVSSGVAAIGMATTIGGGILNAAGTAQSAEARARQNQYQASIAGLNAQIAEQNEEYASQKGEQDSQKYGLAAGQTAGKIVAAQSSSGLDVNSGSAKQVQESQKLVTSMDLTQIRSNAAKVAYDYKSQAQDFRNRGLMYTAGAADERTAGRIGVEASILGTASSVASRWLQGRQMGLWGGGSGGASAGNDGSSNGPSA